MVLLASVSCVEDEYGNVVGTWVYKVEVSPGHVAKKVSMPPDVNPTPCEDEFLSISFYNDLTGSQLKKSNTNEECEPTPDSYSFEYNIKEGVLTINYDGPQETPEGDFNLSGENSFLVVDNELTITSEEGIVTVLTKQ